MNAAAGTGRAPKRLEALLAEDAEIASRSRTVYSTSASELDAALTLADDEIPVAVGGDGSLNALVSLLDRRGELQRTIGIVPFGTGNATAHTLGLRSPSVGMSALLRGATTNVDIIRTSMARTPIALVSCSTGFESGFLRRYAALRYISKQRAGWTALLTNVSRKIRGVTLTVDGQPWVNAGDLVHNVGVYNIPHYAFGKVMWRGMRTDDGLAIAARVASPLSYWNLMAFGITAPLERDTSETSIPGVRTIRWQTAELTSPTSLQVDGESTDDRHATLSVDAGALTVIRA